MSYDTTMRRPSDYFISPRDLAMWGRGLRLRDAIGLALMLVAALAVGLWLQDPGAGLFAAGLVLALWWRVDSRWAFGAALALLVLIPLMQYLYDRNWLYSGSALAGGLAVTVWYLLAIGVVRAVAELRTVPVGSPAPAESGAPGPSGAPAKVTKPDYASTHGVKSTPVQAAPASVPAPATRRPPVPSWRRRLDAIEADTRAPTSSRSLDGLRGRRR
jgi:hypothetical protein